MVSLRHIVITCVVFVLLTTHAAAQPTVEFDPPTNSNGTPSGVFSIELVSGKWQIGITKQYTGLIGPFTITVGASQNEPIRFIRIDQRAYSTTNRVHVRGTNQFNRCGPVEHIEAIGTTEIKLVELDMVGTLGKAPYTGQDVIEGFDQIGGLEITGDVYGDIVTPGVSQNSIYVIEGDLHGNLIALAGYHRDIKIKSVGGTGGNLYGDIIAVAGRIKRLEVDESIGSPGEPVNIQSMDMLDYLKCQDLYANIDTTLYGVSAAIFELYVESSDPARGNFEGTINCGYFWNENDPNDGSDPPRFVISGEQRGEVIIARPLLESVGLGTIVADTLFSIGYALLDESTIDIDGSSTDPKGLKGQVIINGANGANSPDGVWTWDGTVNVDGTALAPVPYYNNATADVGGGAVGLVPYYCYYKDCTPIGNKYMETSTGLDQLGECDAGYHALLKISYAQLNPSVTIRHYGPIKQQGTGKPFTVKRISSSAAPCDGMGNPNWIDVTDAVVGGPFTHTLHPNGELRALQVAGPFEDGFDYLIEPKTTGSDMLLCDGLTDPMEVEPVMDYDYRIRVFYLQNTTMSNGLEPNDITEWVNNPTDTTLDGTTDNADLIDVIEAVTNSND